jgi:hypothetical protein
MIATFEQMNFERKMAELEEEEVDGAESDDEIRELKQKLKKRRNQLKESAGRGGMSAQSILSDGQTDTTTTTDQSASPAYSSPGEEGGTTDPGVLDSADEDFADWERSGGLELPGGSAESIALSLLSRYGQIQRK